MGLQNRHLTLVIAVLLCGHGWKCSLSVGFDCYTPHELSCPSWQQYLAAKSSDWTPSALSFPKACCSIFVSYPSGIALHGECSPEAQLFSVQSMMFKANGFCFKHETLLNLFPWFTLPNMSTEDLERTPETECKFAPSSWGLGPLLWNSENEHSSHFWWWSGFLEPLTLSVSEKIWKTYLSTFFFPLYKLLIFHSVK